MVTSPFNTTPKGLYLGSMVDSTMKTTTPTTTKQTNISPVTPSNPAATLPKAPVTPFTSSTPKAAFVNTALASTGTAGTPTGPTSNGVTTPSGAVVDQTTGALVSGPPNGTAAVGGDPSADYKAALDAYMAILMPSSAENDATSYLNNLILQSKRDQETALNRGETLGFATGEAARVNRENQFGIEAASNAVNALTAKRTGLVDANKARLDFVKSILDQKGKVDTPSDFSLSPGEERYTYDSKTGEFKKVASAPRAPEKGTEADKKSNAVAQINSTLITIMGRMSAYTGKDVTWDEVMNSDMSLGPKVFEFGPVPGIPEVPPVIGTEPKLS